MYHIKLYNRIAIAHENMLMYSTNRLYENIAVEQDDIINPQRTASTILAIYAEL